MAGSCPLLARSSRAEAFRSLSTVRRSRRAQHLPPGSASWVYSLDRAYLGVDGVANYPDYDRGLYGAVRRGTWGSGVLCESMTGVKRASAITALVFLTALAALQSGCTAGAPAANSGAPAARALPTSLAGPPEWKTGDRWNFSWTSGRESGTKTLEIVEVRDVNQVRYYVVRLGGTDHLTYYTRELHWAAAVRESRVEARMVPAHRRRAFSRPSAATDRRVNRHFGCSVSSPRGGSSVIVKRGRNVLPRTPPPAPAASWTTAATLVASTSPTRTD